MSEMAYQNPHYVTKVMSELSIPPEVLYCFLKKIGVVAQVFGKENIQFIHHLETNFFI